jgi:hypothetical protein
MPARSTLTGPPRTAARVLSPHAVRGGWLPEHLFATPCFGDGGRSAFPHPLRRGRLPEHLPHAMCQRRRPECLLPAPYAGDGAGHQPFPEGFCPRRSRLAGLT